MNSTPVYRLLDATKALPLINLVVTTVERVLRSYRYELYRSKYDLHESFLERNNEGIHLYGDGEIHSGSGSYIGRYSRIRAGEDTRVVIGSGCAISHDTAIYTTSWSADQDFRGRDPGDFSRLKSHSGDVVIGDHTWIGYGVFVTPGTRVGEDAVVGANAVVTRDIPPHSIAVGAPAKVVKFKEHLSDEGRKRLAERSRDILSDELRATLQGPQPGSR